MALELDAGKARGRGQRADRAHERRRFDPRKARRPSRRPKAFRCKRTMRMLPETKLDIMLARHASLTAELAGPLAGRNLCEAHPRARRDRAGGREGEGLSRRAVAEIADLDSMIADPATEPEMRAVAERGEAAARSAPRRARARHPAGAHPQGRDGRHATSSSKSAPAPAATRRRCSPATSSACTSAMPRKHGWKTEILSASEGTKGGFKEIIAEIAGRGAFARLKFESGVHRVQRVPDTEASGRIHTSAATVAVLPEVEDVDVAINDDRSAHRHHAVAGRRRPARQQDRIGGAHHPHPVRHRRDDAGGALAAPQPRQGDGAAARQALRRRAAAARRRARRRPARPGRQRRPLRAHPHLQFPAGARHRPPHQPDALQAAPGDRGRGAGRDHRCARHRAPGLAAGRAGRRAPDGAARP